MRPLLVAAVAALVLGTGGGAATATTTAVSTGPPSGLTERGRVLWQFEALLRDTFGGREVCATGRSRNNFTTTCGALAFFSPYDYVFAGARGSAFHVSSKKACCYGNHPQSVLIRRRNIACNVRETMFLLVNLARVHFSLSCSRAGWTSP